MHYTDPTPLTYLLAKQADTWLTRQQHRSYVAEYTEDI